MLLNEPLCRRLTAAPFLAELVLDEKASTSAASLRGDPVALPGESFPLS